MILVLIGTTMLPWKQHQNFQKYQNPPNFMKLHSNDEQHWQMWLLEFPKWLLLPWKQCKTFQKNKNAANWMKHYRNGNWH